MGSIPVGGTTFDQRIKGSHFRSYKFTGLPMCGVREPPRFLYHIMEEEFSLIDSFFSSINLIGVRTMRLNSFTVSLDLKRTLEAERFIVKSNIGKKAFLPDLRKLYEMKWKVLSECDFSVDTKYLLNI